MKSLRIDGQGAAHIETVPEPTPEADQVLVKTAVSALCGSELHAFRGDGMAKGNSGHEAAGTVVAVGAEVQGITVGQRVGVSAVVGCGRCAQCAEGRYTWCSSWKFFPNMHAEQFVIPARGCHVLPDDVAWPVGALITGDGLGVPYHTSRKLLRHDIRTVVVWGLGPIGLGNVLVQAHAGRRVIGVDLVEERRALALKCGAADVVDGAADNAVEEVRSLAGPDGADAAIEAVGRPETVKHCIAAVRRGGTVILNGEQPAVELSPSSDFIRRDITVTGSWYYHFHEFAGMLGLCRQGLDVQCLVTHEFAFDDAPEAFTAFAGSATGKVILRYAE
jgi:threonine dehydrogenase-like Zn-dependent dehydrogenase